FSGGFFAVRQVSDLLMSLSFSESMRKLNEPMWAQVGRRRGVRHEVSAFATIGRALSRLERRLQPGLAAPPRSPPKLISSPRGCPTIYNAAMRIAPHALTLSLGLLGLAVDGFA